MAYIGKQPTVGNFVKLDSIVTSATTTFNLLNGGVAYFPQSANHCLVSLNGILQAPIDSFTISGSTIIFSSALTTSDVIDFIIVLGDVLNIGTPSDATVGFSKITSNLITGATAVTAPATDDVLLCYDTSATALRKITFADFGNTPAFHAYRGTSTQTITSGSNTKIQFNAEVFDTNNCFDSTTNYRFTPTVSGYYFIRITLVNDTNGTFTAFYPMIYKNGSVAFYGDNCQIGTTAYPQTSVTGIVNCNGTTDYIEAYAYSTSNIGIPAGTTNVSFQGFKLIGT